MKLIMACTPLGGIGKNGTLPWRIKEDMALFKRITTTTKNINQYNIVIMGRKTWESIPAKFRPLPNRINMVVSTTMKQSDIDKTYTGNNVFIANSITDINIQMNNIKSLYDIDKTFVIGGANIYEQLLNLKLIDTIHISYLMKEYDCDTFIDINTYLTDFKCEISEQFNKFEYKKYRKIKIEK